MSHPMHAKAKAKAKAKAMAFQIEPKNLFPRFMDEDEKQTSHAQVVMSEQQGEGEANHDPKVVKPIIPPPSPESPWTLSPLRTPSPPLVYHCIASLHRGEGNIYSIAVSKGVVFTGSDSTRIRAWKQPDCMDRGYLKAAAGGVKAISASGNMLFTSHKDLRIRVWNFRVSENMRWKKVCSLPKRGSLFPLLSRTETAQAHKDSISCMAYYPAEDLLYTASHDRTVKAWRLSDRKCVDSFLAHDDRVNSLALNHAHACLFTASSDATVKIWRRLYPHNSHTLTMTLRFQSSPVNAVVLCSDEAGLLYSGSADGSINLWEKERVSCRYKHVGLVQGHRFAVLCLAAVGRVVVSGSEDTTVRIWRRQEAGGYCHECLAVLEGHRGPVRCLAAAIENINNNNVSSSFLVYSGSLDRTFKVWRVKVALEDKMKMCFDHSISNINSKLGELYQTMSPVLSPSWVQNKLQANYF